MPVREPAGLAISISGCSARNAWSPGHLVLAGRRHDVHNGPVSCHCRDRGQGDQRHFLAGVQQGPRLPRERTRCRRIRLPVPWCETPSGPAKRQPRAPLGGGRRRGTDVPVIAGPARPAGQPAARPGRCARRSDRRGSSMLDSGPGARCSSGPASPSPRSGRRANLPRHEQPQDPRRWLALSASMRRLQLRV